MARCKCSTRFRDWTTKHFEKGVMAKVCANCGGSWAKKPKRRPGRIARLRTEVSENPKDHQQEEHRREMGGCAEGGE